MFDTLMEVLKDLFERKIIFKNLQRKKSMQIYLAFKVLTFKAPITTAADDNFCDIFLNFLKKKV